MTTFVLIHGWGGNHEGHWQHWLSDELIDAGHNVIYPTFSSANTPILNEWLDELKHALKGVDPKDIVLLSHSLGNTLWLHYLRNNPGLKIKKGFLIAPPLTNQGIREIQNFFPQPWVNLSKEDYVLIGSDDDMYIKKEEFIELSNNLNVPFHFIANAGHIHISSGFGPWPWIKKECLKLV